jgi:sec-independent protein translocase protein TatC
MKKDDLQLQATITQYMPYILEIRKRLLFVVAVFIIASIISFIYFEPIIKKVMQFYDLKGLNIVFTSPFQYINLSVNTAIAIGVFVTFPLVIFQTLSFLKPALREKEYKLILSLIPLSIILFIAGFAFGGWTMKLIISVFLHQPKSLNIQNLWNIESFISNIFATSIFMGLLFQFPIVLTPLIRLKVIPYQKLVQYRATIYVALLILVMLLPGTDILTDFLMFFPLAFLFEFTLLLNRRYR